jgi:putative phosphoesterase
MTTKILLMSDSHYADDAMEKAVKKYPNMDYYVHCGDSMVSPKKMEGFITVAGNLDFPCPYPNEAQLKIGNYRIWIIHGHHFINGSYPDYKTLAREAKQRDCNVVFFGHTHTYYDNTIDGIRLLNPGSVWKTRDPNEICSLMLVEIDKNKLTAKRINYVTLLY